jgi:hypothetical protein
LAESPDSLRISPLLLSFAVNLLCKSQQQPMLTAFNGCANLAQFSHPFFFVKTGVRNAEQKIVEPFHGNQKKRIIYL